ncbi:MAG: hypothetical protein MJ180_01175 [Candidatus Gastranaerophilales bacterium]|nr:hypothetical protein [Candidatus Gastranaerophilales bacterium]
MIIEKITTKNVSVQNSATSCPPKPCGNNLSLTSNQKDVFVSKSNNISFKGTGIGGFLGLTLGGAAGVALACICPPVGAALLSGVTSSALAGGAAIGLAGGAGGVIGMLGGDKAEDIITGNDN